MPAPTPSIALKQAMAAAWLAALDSAAGQASVELYTGTKPSGPDTVITTQTLLGTGTCSTTTGVVNTAGSNVSLVFNAITGNNAVNSGTAAWARIKNDSGTAVFDVDAGTTGGSAFLQMNTTAIVAPGPLSFVSLTINF